MSPLTTTKPERFISRDVKSSPAERKAPRVTFRYTRSRKPASLRK